ncbi:hypothetical protein [Alsobacter metallidurans]|uniref:hypothetical protein n=1 Tax=Alsobacter metallidurans TaxID=340221 RepID=UPI00166A5859|nr:hypothetical protein [Alsobacter metallidurans]
MRDGNRHRNILAKATKNGPCAAYGYLALSGPNRTAMLSQFAGLRPSIYGGRHVRMMGADTTMTVRGKAATRDRKRATRKHAG